MIVRPLRIALSVLVAAMTLGLLALGSCTNARYVFVSAPRAPHGPPAEPALSLADDEDAVTAVGPADWSRRAERLRAVFESEVYGAAPPDMAVSIVESRLVDDSAFGVAGVLEEHRIVIGHGAEAISIRVALALPQGDGPFPVFLVPNECGNAFALEHDGLTPAEDWVMPWCEPDGWERALTSFVFGRYALWPPTRRLLARGYAVAAFHESQIAPDNARISEPVLAALTPETAPAEARAGALAVWAWGMAHVARALETDPRIDPEGVIAYGHSRRGKAVLVAGAYHDEIDMVIAHQSGTGGASLSRREVGESVADVTRDYPHWFAPAFAGYAGREDALPVDQHQLLALIAPKPLLLGNAWRDTWSDPAGAFLAAQAAGPAWRIHGYEGFNQHRLDQWAPQARLAFHIRRGTHGVTPEDWAAFLDFADAHLRQSDGGR